MNVRIRRSDAVGTVKVPTSKSYTIRAALCAAMAPGRSVVVAPLESSDTAAVLDCLQALGAGVRAMDGSVEIEGGRLRAPEKPLWCNESAATMRFLMALAAAVPGVTVLRCAPSLARRPMTPLCDVLSRLGARCEEDVSDGTVTIRGRTPEAADVAMRGDVSSQYISALLLSGPLYPDGLSVRLETPLVSARYVDMTLECMAAFGVRVQAEKGGRSYQVPSGAYSPAVYTVEGDWSAAAALLALGAVSGPVAVTGLNCRSLQADVLMPGLLKRFGARVTASGGTVEVTRSPGATFDVDVSETIDLLPVLMALAAVPEGVSTIRGVARARAKESDRVVAMADGLRKMGVETVIEDDEVAIKGGAAHGAVVSSYGDHRIAMAFGVLGTVVGDTTVQGADCVRKTYPGFWKDIERLGVHVEYHE